MRWWHFTISLVIITIWILWFVLIIRFGSAGETLGIGQSFTFSQSGQFGDSFGVIASFMATLAASAAFFTYFSQKKQQAAQGFEQNFYSLLNNSQISLSQIDVTRRRASKDRSVPEELKFPYGEILARHEGREAIRVLHKVLKINIKTEYYRDSKKVCRVYSDFFDKWHDDLGHYFRIIYNILKLIDEKCETDKRYYVRILRAHLSNSEQCLIAYNCICGEGRFEFKALVGKYALLHNLHRTGLDEKSATELKFFIRKLPDSAFRFDNRPAFSYDS